MRIGDLVKIGKRSPVVRLVGKVGLVVKKDPVGHPEQRNWWIVAFSDGSTYIFHRTDLLEVPNENR